MGPSVVLIVTFLLSVDAYFYPCIPCRGEVCEIEPPNCKFGVERLCGRKVCAKGPGQKCGGYQNMHGVCGLGLSCDDCGFCKGCVRSSVTQGVFECYYSDPSMCYSK